MQKDGTVPAHNIFIIATASFPFLNFDWSLVAFQCCVSFCGTAK